MKTIFLYPFAEGYIAFFYEEGGLDMATWGATQKDALVIKRGLPKAKYRVQHLIEVPHD